MTVPTTSSRDRARRGRARQVGSPEGVPVHRRVHERGDRLGGHHRRRATQPRASSNAARPGREHPRRPSSTNALRLVRGGSPAPRPRCHGRTGPVRAPGPRLALPDRYGALARCRCSARGVERLGPVGCRHRHQDTGLADVERPDAVQQRQPADRRATARRADAATSASRGTACLGEDLVLQGRDPGPSVGVVADHAAEGHHRAAAAERRPRRRPRRPAAVDRSPRSSRCPGLCGGGTLDILFPAVSATGAETPARPGPIYGPSPYGPSPPRDHDRCPAGRHV